MKLSDKTIKKLDEIHSTYITLTREVLVGEARANNPYKVGDIIEDHYQIGKIESVVISLSTENRTYSISYKCDRLTKKLTPYRGGEKSTIYGSNIKTK